MANKKISELSEVVDDDVTDDDVIPVVNGGVTKKVKISSLKQVFLPNGVFYFGEDPASATWRFIIVGSNLQLQFKDGVTWYNKENYTPELS